MTTSHRGGRGTVHLRTGAGCGSMAAFVGFTIMAVSKRNQKVCAERQRVGEYRDAERGFQQQHESLGRAKRFAPREDDVRGKQTRQRPQDNLCAHQPVIRRDDFVEWVETGPPGAKRSHHNRREGRRDDGADGRSIKAETAVPIANT